jgi:hypothetical protein
MDIVKVSDIEITQLIQHLYNKSETFGETYGEPYGETSYVDDDDWVILDCKPSGWTENGVRFTIECASGGYHVLSGLYALYMQYPNVLSFLLWASQNGILGMLGIVVTCTIGAAVIPVFYLKSTGVFTSTDLYGVWEIVKKEIK